MKVDNIHELLLVIKKTDIVTYIGSY